MEINAFCIGAGLGMVFITVIIIGFSEWLDRRDTKELQQAWRSTDEYELQKLWREYVNLKENIYFISFYQFVRGKKREE